MSATLSKRAGNRCGIKVWFPDWKKKTGHGGVEKRELGQGADGAKILSVLKRDCANFFWINDFFGFCLLWAKLFFYQFYSHQYRHQATTNVIVIIISTKSLSKSLFVFVILHVNDAVIIVIISNSSGSCAAAMIEHNALPLRKKSTCHPQITSTLTQTPPPRKSGADLKPRLNFLFINCLRCALVLKIPRPFTFNNLLLCPVSKLAFTLNTGARFQWINPSKLFSLPAISFWFVSASHTLQASFVFIPTYIRTIVETCLPTHTLSCRHSTATGLPYD